MTTIKDVWYEVRYQIPINLGSSVITQSKTKVFKDRKKAELFFNELPCDFSKWLVLCEQSIVDCVYSKKKIEVFYENLCN